MNSLASVANPVLKPVIDGAPNSVTAFANVHVNASSIKKHPKIHGLESIRGLAALYVLLYHANKYLFHDRYVLLRFGQEAVMTFFLLSGFVIAYTSLETGKNPEVWDYAVKRLRRIYPLFLIAILVAAAANYISGWCPPPRYQMLAWKSADAAGLHQQAGRMVRAF
jgi:peptidoglycan/LPS O-acetylase OafA/YrhL